MPLAILVIAHEDGIRHLLTAVLGADGYQIFTAENGDVGLGLAEHQSFDLIVTDVPAPSVDRRDFFPTLSKLGSIAPIVVMARSNAAEIAQKVGAVDYLDKPFTVYQVRVTIAAAIKKAGHDLPSIVSKEQERSLRVFVYTNQRFLAQMIKMTLDHGVFIARAGQDVIEAKAIIRDWQPHLVVVDLDSDKGELLDQIGLDRAAGALPVPMIGVCRSRDLQTILSAFDKGVDDVLTVPISPQELLVRVVAIMRRTFGQTFPLRPIILQGTLTIDIVKHVVSVGNSDVLLTTTEESLLYLLAANAGEVITNQEILATIWGDDGPADPEVVELTIVNLRKKLQNGWAKPWFIVSYPQIGHRFLPNVEPVVAAS